VWLNDISQYQSAIALVGTEFILGGLPGHELARWVAPPVQKGEPVSEYTQCTGDWRHEKQREW
jgi:hypothetical protein